MNNEKVLKKYGIRKKVGIAIVLQGLLIITALIITIIGIVKSTNSLNRLVIYVGQAITCLSIIIFAFFHFKNANIKQFKVIINCYALLEALRVALLNVNGIKEPYAILAKFILVILACDCILIAERLDKKSCVYISYALLALEIILYIVFLIGFPVVGQRKLYTILPFVGILIASSICLFNKARIEQNENKKL